MIRLSEYERFNRAIHSDISHAQFRALARARHRGR